MRVIRSIIFVALMVMLITPAGFAQEASPATEDARSVQFSSFQDRFAEMAASVPDWLERDGVSVSYADLAHWSAALGVDPAQSEDGLISVAVGQGMAIPPAFMYAILFPSLGFTSTQVNRTLLLDAVTDRITVMEGEFDFAAMETALLESGYVAEEIEGIPVFVFGGDDHLDLESDAGALAFTGKTQYVVMLADGLVGFTNKRAWAEEIVAARLGDGRNLAANTDVQDLIASSRADLISAQIWSVDSLGEDVVTSDLAGSTADRPAMPPFRWILFGDSVGVASVVLEEAPETHGEPIGVIVLQMEDADAVDAALSVVPARFDEQTSDVTGVPYADLLTLISAEEGSSATTAVFEFEIPIVGRISHMWLMRDLAFIYPG